MESTADRYREIIKRFTAWAEEQHNIRAAMIVGSRARTADRPADEWSDLDIAVFVESPEAFLFGHQWIEEISPYWLTFLEPSGAGQGMERRVLFEGGLDVDFAVFPVAALPQMTGDNASFDVKDTLQRGIEVILDKGSLLKDLEIKRGSPGAMNAPSQKEFTQLVSDFLYHAVWTAKKLRRCELLTAKECCDDYMKQRLLKMSKWHAFTTRGKDHNTWHGGRFFEQWADPRIVEGLRNAFAHYDENDIWRSLFATVDLFRWIASETADRLGLSYPTSADGHITELMQSLYSERQ